jgi:hypothetical protein
MTDSRPSSLGTTLLILGIALAAVAGVVAFLPVLPCDLGFFLEYTEYTCPYCQGRNRLTLLQRWRFGPRASLPWEGETLSWIEGSGFQKTNFREALDLAGLFGGLPFTNEKRIAAAKALIATGLYRKVSVVGHSWEGGARVDVNVEER